MSDEQGQVQDDLGLEIGLALGLSPKNREEDEDNDVTEEFDLPEGKEEEVQEPDAEEDEDVDEGEKDPGDEDPRNRRDAEGDDDPDGDEYYEDEEVDDDSQDSQELQMLRQQMGQMQMMMQQLQAQNQQLQQALAQAQNAPPQQQSDPLEGMDFDDVISDPNKFREVLKRVSQAQQQQIDPNAIAQQVAQQQARDRLFSRFNQDNPELSHLQGPAAQIATQLIQSGMVRDEEHLLREMANRVRQTYGIPQPKKRGGKKPVRRKAVGKPANSRKGSKRKPPKKKINPKSLEGQIEAMLGF